MVKFTNVPHVSKQILKSGPVVKSHDNQDTCIPPRHNTMQKSPKLRKKSVVFLCRLIIRLLQVVSISCASYAYIILVTFFFLHMPKTAP